MLQYSLLTKERTDNDLVSCGKAELGQGTDSNYLVQDLGRTFFRILINRKQEAGLHIKH